MRRSPLLFLLACQDYELVPRDTAKYPYTLQETGVPPTKEEEVPPCLDDVKLPSTSAVDESCAADPETNTLYATVEWSTDHFLEAPEYTHTLSVPVVGQLTDDNGDGTIDSDDVPDIVLTSDDQGEDGANTHGVMRVIRGDDGEVVADVSGAILDVGDTAFQIYPYRYASAALADLDRDGQPEIVGVAEIIVGGGGGGDTAPPETGGPEETGVIIRPPPPDGDGATGSCGMVAWNVDGTLQWADTTDFFLCAGHAPAVADLEGDGVPEVILGAAVRDGLTGALLWAGATGEGRYWAYPDLGSQSFALDLDLDGLQEVLAGRTVYATDGTTRCNIADDLDDGFPAAANFDGDALGEFVLVGNGVAHVHDTDCSLLALWTLAGEGNGGPPTVADFDADGAPEIGIAEAQSYTVYEPDGTILWSNPITDASSHATGSSVFDFDGDGRAEVVYADETTLWIFDGVSGTVRLRDPGHTSRTLHEYPVIADVDSDGMVEIVVPQGGGHYGIEHGGLYVLGSADRTWMGDRELWNQHAYSITNIEDDLTLPAPAVPNWPTYNTFRSGDLTPTSGGRLGDAVPYAATCPDPCESGDIVVAVKVGNGGLGTLRAGLPVSVYAEDGGRLRHLATTYTPDPLDSGANSATLPFRIDADYVPEGVLLFQADDDNGTGVVNECHEDNNLVRLEGLFCPEAKP